MWVKQCSYALNFLREDKWGEQYDGLPARMCDLEDGWKVKKLEVRDEKQLVLTCDMRATLETWDKEFDGWKKNGHEDHCNVGDWVPVSGLVYEEC
jgi:hypothetical protein